MQVTHSSNGTEQYAYAPDGKRVWSKNLTHGVEFFHYYDVTGKLLGVYWIVGPGQVTTNDTAKYIYFGSKVIVAAGKTVVLDRLGSVRLKEGGADRVNYSPYGEERTTTPGWDKFATYKRDAHSGLDYADQGITRVCMGGF